jgi:muramoyltetrapeptide carboxypeptidase
MKASLSAHAETGARIAPRKPKALAEGSRVAIFSPASPADAARTEKGIEELQRLGFSVEPSRLVKSEGYFSAAAAGRKAEFLKMLAIHHVRALFALRGGYGSNYLLDELNSRLLESPKCLVGHSDLTSLQIFLWQKSGWVTFYGPMAAAGLDAGEDSPHGYDRASLQNALTKTSAPWSLALRGEALLSGQSEGRILGGCMTLIEATLRTPWELETKDSILLLEDRGMKPWQVDRVLMHLKQAGKFEGVQGIVLGEFPECDPPVAGSASVRDICARLLAPLSIPVVFGAAVGHTPRPMLTVPLGVRSRLHAEGEGILEILEPAVLA